MNETKTDSITLDRLRPGATNPRKHFDPDYIGEMANSIRQHGIIQPLTVRPDWCIGKTSEEIAQVNGNAPAVEFFEIVAGECRYRGAVEAPLAAVPTIVRFLGDKETLEIQLIENLQRKDITAVEEAQAYRALLDMGHTVETIHQRTGLEIKTIYGKLKIIRAPDFLLEALEKKIVGARICEIVGRIPLPEMREKAGREILNPGLFIEGEYGSMHLLDNEPMSVRLASMHVQTRYMRQLSGGAGQAPAPFDQDDAGLVPVIDDDQTGERIGGGACTDCPMRSGNSPHVTGEIKRPDICMNPVCFAKKSEVHFAILQQNAVAEGKQLLTDDDSRQLFDERGKLRFDSPFVFLAEQPDRESIRDDVKKVPSWKTLLEGLESKPPVTLARHPKRGLVELVNEALAIEAVKLAAKQKGEKSIFDLERARGTSTGGGGTSAGSSSGTTNSSAASVAEAKRRKDEKDKARLNFDVTLAAISAVIGKIDEAGPVKGFWDALIRASITHAGHDGCWLICKRYGLDPKAGKHVAQFASEGVEGAVLEFGLSLVEEKQKLGFVVELLVSQRIKFYQQDGIEKIKCFVQFADLYDVDLVEVRKTVAAKAKEKPAAKKTPKTEPTPPSEIIPKPPVRAAKHEWEKITGNKYRCKGCGAAAVKHDGKILEEKAVRGKPCSLSEMKPAAPNRAKRTVARTVKPKAKAKKAAGKKSAKGGGKK